MSKAIVKSNELKSSLHHQVIETEDIYDAIIEIETIFPYITLSHFSKEQVTPLNLYQKLFLRLMITIHLTLKCIKPLMYISFKRYQSKLYREK